MTMRFKVTPRDVPPAAAARRLGLTLEAFQAKLHELRQRGFPAADSTTGNYDLDAIDVWEAAHGGCVYFIKCEGFIKIGFSNNPRGRLGELQAATPFQLELLSQVRGGPRLEARLHIRFERLWVRREWFCIDDDLLRIALNPYGELYLREELP